MKEYNSTNFFKHTYCQFQVVDFDFDADLHFFKSKSGSLYHYTKEGVYRCSNHWGRVADCRWRLRGIENYKNQLSYVGYAAWSQFYSLDNSERIFYLVVDLLLGKTEIRIKKDEKVTAFLFSIQNVIKREKEIQQFFKDDKWLRYIEGDEVELKNKVVRQLVSSNKTLREIKIRLKKDELS